MGKEEEITRPEKLVAKIVKDDVAVGIYNRMVRKLLTTQKHKDSKNEFQQKDLKKYGYEAENEGSKDAGNGELRHEKAIRRIEWLIEAGLIGEMREKGHHPVYFVRGLAGIKNEVGKELARRFDPSFLDWLFDRMGKKHYFDSDEDDVDKGIQIFGLQPAEFPLIPNLAREMPPDKWPSRLRVGLVVSEANKKNVEETFWDERRGLIEKAITGKGSIDQSALSEIFARLGVDNLCELHDLLLGFKVIHETTEEMGCVFSPLSTMHLTVLDQLYPDGWVITICSERFVEEFADKYRRGLSLENLNELVENDRKLRHDFHGEVAREKED